VGVSRCTSAFSLHICIHLSNNIEHQLMCRYAAGRSKLRAEKAQQQQHDEAPLSPRSTQASPRRLARVSSATAKPTGDASAATITEASDSSKPATTLTHSTKRAITASSNSVLNSSSNCGTSVSAQASASDSAAAAPEEEGGASGMTSNTITTELPEPPRSPTAGASYAQMCVFKATQLPCFLTLCYHCTISSAGLNPFFP